MGMGTNAVTDRLRQTRLAPSYRYLRTLDQQGLLPSPLSGEAKEIYIQKVFETVMHGYVLSGVGFSVKEIGSMQFLRTPSNRINKNILANEQSLLNEIDKRCDEMSFWIKSLQQKIKQFKYERPLAKGHEVEALIYKVLNQESIKTIHAGSPLPGNKPAFDFICETESGATIFVEVKSRRPSTTEQNRLIEAALAHAKFSHSQCFAIKKIRTQQGLSLRELAKLSGVSNPMIFGAEIGRYIPSQASLNKIARALNVPCIELVNFLAITPDGETLMHTGTTSAEGKQGF